MTGRLGCNIPGWFGDQVSECRGINRVRRDSRVNGKVRCNRMARLRGGLICRSRDWSRRCNGGGGRCCLVDGIIRLYGGRQTGGRSVGARGVGFRGRFGWGIRVGCVGTRSVLVSGGGVVCVQCVGICWSHGEDGLGGRVGVDRKVGPESVRWVRSKGCGFGCVRGSRKCCVAGDAGKSFCREVGGGGFVRLSVSVGVAGSVEVVCDVRFGGHIGGVGLAVCDGVGLIDGGVVQGGSCLGGCAGVLLKQK